MPIEIRELIIRATVRQDGGEEPRRAGPGGKEERVEIVADCVEQVLEILRKEKER